MSEQATLAVPELLRDIAGHLKSIDGRLGTIEVRLDAIEARLGKVEVRLAELEIRVVRLEERIGALPTWQQMVMLLLGFFVLIAAVGSFAINYARV